MRSPSHDERAAEIGRVVRSLRKDRGITQVFAARKAGISREELCRIEGGRVMPMTRTLEGLCDVLEVPLAELLAKGEKAMRGP